MDFDLFYHNYIITSMNVKLLDCTDIGLFIRRLSALDLKPESLQPGLETVRDVLFQLRTRVLNFIFTSTWLFNFGFDYNSTLGMDFYVSTLGIIWTWSTLRIDVCDLRFSTLLRSDFTW